MINKFFKQKNTKLKIISIIILSFVSFTILSLNALAEDYELSVDVWLIFSVDQDVITPETTLLTGTLMKHEDTIIRVRVNNVKIAEKRIAENDDTFSIETDFSNYNIGDKVVISREYAGVNSSGSNVKIWNQQVSYRITSSDNSNTTPFPTIAPTPTPLVTPNEYEVVGDAWLLFGVDQNVITTDTSLISGSLSMTDYESVIKIKVNNVTIAEKQFNKDDKIFSIETDFSNYKDGDEVIISREYTGANNSSNIKIWDQQIILKIGRPSTIENTSVPLITPKPDSEPTPNIVPTTTPNVTDKTVSKTTIKLNKRNVTLKKGKKIKLIAKITTNKKKPKITWNIGNKKVVKVIKRYKVSKFKGYKAIRIKALKKGKSIITVSVGNKKAKCIAKVK